MGRSKKYPNMVIPKFAKSLVWTHKGSIKSNQLTIPTIYTDKPIDKLYGRMDGPMEKRHGQV